MTASPVDLEAAPSTLREALDVDVGSLLLDADVSRIVVRGDVDGLRVCRRGRYETLDAKAQSLVDAARSWLALHPAQAFQLTNGVVRVAGREDAPVVVVDLDVRRAQPLSDLVQEGLLDDGSRLTLLQALSSGMHVVVVGPHRTGAQRLKWAVAHDVASTMVVASSASAANVDAALHLAAVGDAAVLDVDVWVADAKNADALQATFDAVPCPVVAALPLRHAQQLTARASVDDDGDASSSAAPFCDAHHALVAVVGHGPTGGPRLLELQLPASMAAEAAPPMTSTTMAPPSVVAVPPPAPVLSERIEVPPPQTTSVGLGEQNYELPPLLPLPDAPPADWDDDDDEADAPLGEVPTAPSPKAKSAFAEKLSEVQSRPAFRPRPPGEHPQSDALRQQVGDVPAAEKAAKDDKLPPDPFGGLSFEPPSSMTGQRAPSVDEETP